MRKFFGVVLILIALIVGYNSGTHLRLCLDIEASTRLEMGDWQMKSELAHNGLEQGLAGVGFNADGYVLNLAVQKEHEDEAEIAGASLALIVGIYLVAKRKKPMPIADGAQPVPLDS